MSELALEEHMRRFSYLGPFWCIKTVQSSASPHHGSWSLSLYHIFIGWENVTGCLPSFVFCLNIRRTRLKPQIWYGFRTYFVRHCLHSSHYYFLSKQLSNSYFEKSCWKLTNPVEILANVHSKIIARSGRILTTMEQGMLFWKFTRCVHTIWGNLVILTKAGV